MVKTRGITPALSLGCAAALTVMVASGAAGAPSSAATPPPAVVSSLAPGGDAFNQAVELNATVVSSGEVDASKVAPSTTRFGSPHALYTWVPSSSTAATLNSADVDAKRGLRWVAVEYVRGKAVSALTVDNAGAFVQLGGWPDVQILAGLPDGAQVIGTSLWGDELYQLSDDNRSVTALTPAAQALIGDSAIPAGTFRAAKITQQKTELAKQPTGLPSDAVGAMGPAGGAGALHQSTHVKWSAVGAALAGLVLLGGGGYLLGRRRQRPTTGSAADTSRTTDV